MNREIEFRAWLKKENKMVNVKSIHFGTKKIMYGYSVNSQNYGNKTCKFEDCELMECTQLKDKNETKIFEGDILRLPSYLFDGELCVCVYHDTECGIGFELIESRKYNIGHDYCILSDEWEDFEVVGNIYDNPELLQQCE